MSNSILIDAFLSPRSQEWIELDLFNYGLARFSDAEFEEHGIDADQRHLIRFMAQQEIGHANLISNILQGAGAKQCTYRYNFETVPEFIQFCAVSPTQLQIH